MKTRFEMLLKRYPALGHLIETAYYRLSYRRLKEYLLGTRFREMEWATRHLRKGEVDDWGKGSTDWIRGYWNSQDHRHRPFIIEKAFSFSSVSSILEIGCNCGPNLFLLANKFPKANITGIDINPMAVQKGNEWLAQAGCSNVKLFVGKADELAHFQDKSFDVVFTDAVLIYIGPDRIKEVMKEMIRVARRALILVEWHCFEHERKDPYGLGTYHLGFWRRDYVALLKQFIRKERIHVVKIPEDVWTARGWKEFGAVVEAILE